MIVGIDPGTRRVGIAVADEETRFARPLEVVDTTVTDAVARIAALTRELGVTKIVIGRPVGLSGLAGPAVEAQQSFVAAVREAVEVDVVEHDERLTSVLAERGLRAAGVRGAARKELRDAVAAQVMLQGYLDGGG
ncbi:MAG TPA: Holliday junction resolvase RuvX [Actinomycetota bacterium]|jgi:putative holliday junction resolvase|nr:Holliday junction resolvase RuvX [Actinomycetota bacterium]